jgi:hypothetical protein
MRRAAWLTLAAALVVAACGFGGPTTPSAPTPEPTPPPVSELLGIRCIGGLTFDPSLLGTPGFDETAPDDAAAALRTFALQNARSGVPQRGWIRVAQTADRAEFLARSPDNTTWELAAFSNAGGAWQLVYGGPCDLEVAPPEGTARAEWWIDPGHPVPRATDTTLHLQVLEIECASGRPPIGRVEAPAVRLTETDVEIAVFVRRQPGPQDCPGNPSLPIDVVLPEPLGERRLVDAGVYPPREPLLQPVG